MSMRRAQRSYHCYACEHNFKQLVDMNDLQAVKCPNCQGDFIEETKSFEEAVRQQQPQQAAPQPEPQPQMQNLYQQMQQMPEQDEMQPRQLSHSQSQPVFNNVSQVRQSQTINRSYSPNGGYTQSVTISYGPDQNEPRISHSYSINSNLGGNMRGQAHPQAQHQQMPRQQIPRPHQQFPSMFDRADDFGEIFNDMGMFDGQMGGMFQNMRQPRQPRNSMFGGFVDLGQMMGQRRPASRGGCTEEFINSLPQKDSGKESDCYICLDKCKDGAESVQLPCNHAFDKTCIKHWLKDNDTCPVCRVKLNQDRPMPQQQQQQQNPFVQFFNF